MTPDPGPSAASRLPTARLRAARPAAVLAGVLALFFAPALIGPGQFLYRDAGRMHYPMKTAIARSFARGVLAEWSPHGGLGFPVVAGAVDAPQHPFNLLLVALPFDLGFKLWVLLSYLVAGLGGYVWARRLGRGENGAVLAGIAFALSGFLVSSSDNLQYLTAYASLPWIFAAVHAYVERGGHGRLLLVGLASAFAAAAGDPQSWGLAVVSLPLYAVLLVDRAGVPRRTAFLRGLAACGAAAILAAPFVLPVAAWIQESSRGEAFDWVEYDRFNLLPVRLLELVLPNLLRAPHLTLRSDLYVAYAGNPFTPGPWVLSEYAGASVVALAILGAARSREARLLLLAAAAFAWIAMGSNAGFGQIALRLPVLGNFRYWEKLAVWIPLLLALAAAAGLERLVADAAAGRPSPRRFAAATGAAAALLLSARAAAALFPGALLSLVTPGDRRWAGLVVASNVEAALVHSGLVCALLALVALALARGRLPRLGPALAGVLVAFDLAAGNAGAYVLSPSDLVRPPSPLADFLRAQPGLQRVVTLFPLDEARWPDLEPWQSAFHYGAATIASGWNVPLEVGNFEPYTGMIPVRQMRYRRRTGLYHLLPGVGMWNVAWAVVPDPPEARLPAMNLPPPYDVAARDPSLSASLVRIPHRERAYLASALDSVDRRGAMEFVLDDASVASGRSVVEGEVPAGYAPPGGEARIVRDEPVRVELEVRSDRRALLVLNDNLAAGWTANVDGRPAAILPANYLARGVWVEAGAHLVSFAYRTPLLREGWAVFAMGALALGAHALLRRGRAPPPASP